MQVRLIVQMTATVLLVIANVQWCPEQYETPAPDVIPANVAYALGCHGLQVERMFAHKVASSEQVGLEKMLELLFEAI